MDPSIMIPPVVQVINSRVRSKPIGYRCNIRERENMSSVFLYLIVGCTFFSSQYGPGVPVLSISSNCLVPTYAFNISIAPPLRPRLRRRRNPPSQGQRGTHNHTPGHMLESGPTCGAPRGGSTTLSPTDPGVSASRRIRQRREQYYCRFQGHRS